MNTYTCTLECPNCGHQGAHDHVWDPEHEWAEPFLAECGGCEGLFVVQSWPSPLSIAAGTPGHNHRSTNGMPRTTPEANIDDLLARIRNAVASNWNEFIAHWPGYESFAPATTTERPTND